MNKNLRTVLAGVLLLSLAFGAMAAPKDNLMVREPNREIGGEEFSGLPGVPGPYPSAIGELDEIVGDTVMVDYTWRDMQHNGSIGRMIAVGQSGDTTFVHFVYCKRTSSGGTSKTFHQAGIVVDDVFSIPNFHTAAVDPTWGAYDVIDIDPETLEPFVNYHGPLGAQDYATIIGQESPFLPGFYNNWGMAAYDDQTTTMWPHWTVARHNGNLYFHMLMNGYDPDADDNRLFYGRATYDPVNGFSEATPGGVSQQLVTDKAMNLSSVAASSNDGSKVAFGQTVSRWLQGEGPQQDWDGTRASQVMNDIYLWESTDGGDSWDWNAYTNLTDFTGPDETLLPDTVAASGDTFRAYTEIDLFYDEAGDLHTAFSVAPFVFYEVVASGGAVSVTSRLFYWNSVEQVFTQIADGTHFNGASFAAWEQMASHTNIYKDPDTGILFALYQMHGDSGWYEYDVDDNLIIYDASDDGVASADLYISASPDNGLRWTKGVNITNTHILDPAQLPLVAGEAMAEREPSLAMNNPGDYLNITYTLDRDPGIAEPGGTAPDGDPTENNIVYHRVSKSEILSMFTEYVPNYPLHMDSTDFYQDPNDWAWDSPFDNYSVGDKGATDLQPEQFELEPAYPNPFNPSTRIAFRLQQRGTVELTVFDVLGREVASLVNRTMNAGRHEVTFFAGDLPSGVYFYKLASGEASQVRKMVLMK